MFILPIYLAAVDVCNFVLVVYSLSTFLFKNYIFFGESFKIYNK